jgi:hypothetical protein
LQRQQVLPFFEKLPPCLVAIEACATSHHWARKIESRCRLTTAPSSCPSDKVPGAGNTHCPRTLQCRHSGLPLAMLNRRDGRVTEEVPANDRLRLGSGTLGIRRWLCWVGNVADG